MSLMVENEKSLKEKQAELEKEPNEKEITIQILKKKLKIPATQLIQATKLTELEKEK